MTSNTSKLFVEWMKQASSKLKTSVFFLCFSVKDVFCTILLPLGNKQLKELIEKELAWHCFDFMGDIFLQEETSGERYTADHFPNVM